QCAAEGVVARARDRGGLGVGRLAVFDEVAQRGLFLGADRHVERHRVAGVVEQVRDLLGGGGGTPESAASSACVASRPSRWCMSRLIRASLFTCSTRWTGSRIVRAWSAM